jgi:hypothetical protein
MSITCGKNIDWGCMRTGFLPLPPGDRKQQEAGGKGKLSLSLTKHHAMKTYWESGGIDPRILNLGARWM